MEVDIDVNSSQGRGGVSCETGLLFDLVELLGDGNLLLCGLSSTTCSLCGSLIGRKGSEKDGLEQHPVLSFAGEE